MSDYLAFSSYGPLEFAQTSILWFAYSPPAPQYRIVFVFQRPLHSHGSLGKERRKKFLAVRFRQAPIEDGLDIALVEFQRSKRLQNFFLCRYCLIQIKAHNTSPLPRLQRRQIFVVFPIIQYRPALCKAGGGDFPGFVKPTEFGPSLLILKRDPANSPLHFSPCYDRMNKLIMKCGHGGTGRRARLRGVWATIRVQVPLTAPWRVFL